MWHPRWHQLFRATTVFVAAGWVTAVAVQITDSNTSTLAALLGRRTLQASGLGFALGLVWGPLAAWVQGSARMRCSAGVAAGLLASLTGVYIYFLVWPPNWDLGTTANVVKLFLATYGLRVLPIGAVCGLLASLWAGRVKAPPPDEP